MQGCRTDGYEGCKYRDARLKDTKDRGCRLVNMPRSLVAPTRGAGGYIFIFICMLFCKWKPINHLVQ